MVEVRNLLFQPVLLHLAGDGRGFHMGPRERVQIRDDQVSLEMQMAARRGLIALAPVPEDEPETAMEAEAEAPGPEAACLQRTGSLSTTDGRRIFYRSLGRTRAA